MKPLKISGRSADPSLLEDYGIEEYAVWNRVHFEHDATVYTEKFPCGAYSVYVECDCGSYWQSPMTGCWQRGHQREESGDRFLDPNRWMNW